LADFFISAAGNDAWSGKLEIPNYSKTDGPFATLPRAKEAIRDFKNEGINSIDVNEMGLTDQVPERFINHDSK
jgi:hypothetical protein